MASYELVKLITDLALAHLKDLLIVFTQFRSSTKLSSCWRNLESLALICGRDSVD